MHRSNLIIIAAFISFSLALIAAITIYITHFSFFPAYIFLIIFTILGLGFSVLQLFSSRLFGLVTQIDKKLPETDPNTIIPSTDAINFIDTLSIEAQIYYQIKKVAQEIEQAQDTVEEKRTALETTRDVSADIDEVLRITSSNSRAALLLLSAKIEESMRIRLQEIGVQSKTNYALSRQALDTAVREGRIPQETASALRDFLAVRNKVAHAAVFDVDEATILALVSIGIELLKIIAAKKQENTEVLSSDTA
jgi:uncharacterized protein YutE (UPF0331/DUF86 family)